MERDLSDFVTYLIAERNSSPYTIANYRREIAEFMRFARSQGADSWQQVDRHLVLAWLQSLKERGIAAPSVARRFYELRSFFK